MLTRQQLFDEIEDLLCKRPAPSLEEAMHHLVVSCLSEWERKVYDYSLGEVSVGTGDVAKEFGLALNHACNILKSLHNAGLMIADWDTSGPRPIMTYMAWVLLRY